mmetsp:Transcript_35351/g.77311  ORF Transcript_35351/g.77311 Transcript_35351/m.77311 type:complete len:450 (+) Transcript_35351:56-1405(+)
MVTASLTLRPRRLGHLRPLRGSRSRFQFLCFTVLCSLLLALQLHLEAYHADGKASSQVQHGPKPGPKHEEERPLIEVDDLDYEDFMDKEGEDGVTNLHEGDSKHKRPPVKIGPVHLPPKNQQQNDFRGRLPGQLKPAANAPRPLALGPSPGNDWFVMAQLREAALAGAVVGAAAGAMASTGKGAVASAALGAATGAAAGTSMAIVRPDISASEVGAVVGAVGITAIAAYGPPQREEPFGAPVAPSPPPPARRPAPEASQPAPAPAIPAMPEGTDNVDLDRGIVPGVDPEESPAVPEKKEAKEAKEEDGGKPKAVEKPEDTLWPTIPTDAPGRADESEKAKAKPFHGGKRSMRDVILEVTDDAEHECIAFLKSGTHAVRQLWSRLQKMEATADHEVTSCSKEVVAMMADRLKGTMAYFRKLGDVKEDVVVDSFPDVFAFLKNRTKAKGRE